MATTKETTQRTMSYQIKVNRLANGSHTFQHTVNADGFTLQDVLKETDILQKELNKRFPAPPDADVDTRFKAISSKETESGEHDLKTRQPYLDRSFTQKG